MKRIKHNIGLAIVCGWVALLPTLNAATYYVSPSGSDSNPGTQALPWRTIQQAVNNVQAGDRVLIGSGDYDEVVDTRNSASGTAAGRIVLDGQAGAKLFRLAHHKPYYTIQNLKFGRINTDPTTRSLVSLESGAHQTIISNCFFNGGNTIYSPALNMNAGSGVFGSDAPSSCIIVSNHFTGTKGQSVVYISGTSNLFAYNVVTNVIQCDFLRLFGEYNIIRGNLFSNNVAAPIEESIGYHADFVQTFGNTGRGSRRHIIERNVVIDSESQISQLVEGTAQTPDLIGTGAIGDWTFRNNIFANIKLGASVTIPNTKWYNNVFYRCNYTGGHVLNFGHGDRGSSAGVRVFNNVFLECGLPDRDNSGWYAINESYEDRQFDHNYVAMHGFEQAREENPPSDFRWYEPNGINGGDPGCVNPGSYDFRLRADSPLIGRGLRLSTVTDDFEGRPRPADELFTIGAYHFDSGSPVRPPPPPSNLHLGN